MPTHSLRSASEAARRHLLVWALPRLGELPAIEWPAAIERARQCEFTTLERVAIGVGVACAALLLQAAPAAGATASAQFLGYVVDFLIALPLLLVLVGPVFLHRIRRGLDAAIEQRQRTKGAHG